MIVTWQALSPEALQGVLEEFITREGTDYGHQDWSLAEKVEAVMGQLQTGAAVLVYDEETESCSITSADAVPGDESW